MESIISNLRYWLAGVLVALVGVVCVRLVAPACTGSLRVGVQLGGQLLAFLGLFIICLGVSRRIQQASAPGPEETRLPD